MPDTDTCMIKRELLLRIEEKMALLHSMRPLPADVIRNLREELIVMHTYHSNAIEGNTLTLSETQLIVQRGLTIGGKSLQEHLEATNNAKAFELIETLAKDKAEINHVTIQSVHEVVTKSILEESGKYRMKNVRISSAIHTPPDWTKIVNQIDRLLSDVRNSKLHPIETAACFHHRFVEIHPFVDGNGRVARLLTNLYLFCHEYPAIVLKKEDRITYYHCLKAADSGDLTPLTNFIAKAVDESLTRSLSVYGGYDDLLPLGVLAKNTPYSQEYLSLRARQGVLDAMKIGKRWHTSRRALDTYLELHGKRNP